MIRPGSRVPELSATLTDGSAFRLDEARAAQDYLIVEVYRGRHCPICGAHLEALAALQVDFAALGAAAVAVSMNDRELALEAQREWNVDGLPIAYGLSEETARSWGLYVSSRLRPTEPERFTEPATFVVRRDGILYAADVRSSPHLRPQLDRLLHLVRRARQGYPPRGIA